jgi:glycosyltransferase involved in cell wall biosynthesis
LDSFNNQLFAVARVFASSLFYRDLRTYPWLLFHPPSLGRLFAFLVGADLTKRWVEHWLGTSHLDASQCIFYTYWFDQGAMGIGLAKGKYPKLKLISRAHGYDLYDETFKPPYWPCRPAALGLVDGLFVDSEAGADYLRKRHPASSSKIEVSLLGVQDPGFVANESKDEVLRVMSCSLIRPIKRVDLLLEGVRCAAQMRPDQKFEWHHHGNGEMRLELQQRANLEFPPNARATFHSYSTPQALLTFYRECPVDVFMNVSVSEGTPVSSMEAISCGVPVIATAVGGNKEIVREQNGILLNPDPAPREIADVLCRFMDDRQARRSMRAGSRTLWQERYNADQNFRAFLQRMLSIRGV